MPTDVIGKPKTANDIWRDYDKNYDLLTPEQRKFSMPPANAPMQTAVDPEGRKLSSRYIAGGADGKTPLDMNQIKQLAMMLTHGQIEWVPRSELASDEAARTESGSASATLDGYLVGPPKIKLGQFVTQPGGWMGTLARDLPHETGHAIDMTHWSGIWSEGKRTIAQNLDTDAKANPELRRQFDSMHYGYEKPPNADEVLADSLALYLVDPAGTKKKFPLAAKWLRDHVNTDAMLNRIITLSQANQPQASIVD